MINHYDQVRFMSGMQSWFNARNLSYLNFGINELRKKTI